MLASHRCFVFAAFLSTLCSGVGFAQESKNLATLNINDKKIVFRHFMALTGEDHGEARLMVIATGQPLAADAQKKAKEKGAEESLDLETSAPYLKAVFSDKGEIICLHGRGGYSTFSDRRKPLEGKATIKDGRIVGEVKMVVTGNFAKDVEMTFDVAIDAKAEAKLEKLDPPVKAVVEGKFNGNGKPANLKYVIVREREEFADKPAIRIIFTELDPSKSQKPEFDAGFGKLGNSLSLSVHYDGGIFGCEVNHKAHSKAGFSSVGEINMVEFDLTGGNVKGQVSTGKTLEFFGDKWEVDLKFAAPLPEKMRAAVGKPKVPEKVAPSSSGSGKSANSDTKPEAPKKPVNTGQKFAANKLALPKDAREIDYKVLTEGIHFKSALPVAGVVAEFSAKLKAQGWKDGPGGVVGKKNTILHRELGEAKLTIFITPEGTGSLIKIMSEGMDWTELSAAKEAERAAARKNAAAKSAAEKGAAKAKLPQTAEEGLDDAKAQVKDALKGLPKGVAEDLEKELDKAFGKDE